MARPRGSIPPENRWLGACVIADRFNRPLGSLRVSVTDRCNLRCRYCMPERDYVWLPTQSILTFEELTRMLAAVPGVRDLAMTTNGLLLAKQAAELRRAGLGRITVSLDTLRPDRMREIARTDRHADVLAGIAAARAAGFDRVKINTVVMRGVNDDELLDLIEFARKDDAEVRFIEYMDVGGATAWSPEQVFSRREILAVLSQRYGAIVPITEGRDPSAPAERFRLTDGTTFGIVASTTAPFCRSCDRSRITADGTWVLCLYAERGVDLREPLRRGAGDDELAALIRETWQTRTDRGAEERL